MANYRYRTSRGSSKRPWQRYILPILLTTLAVFSYSKSTYLFNNGSGGQGWKIGRPQINLSNAYNFRSLPEVCSYALALVNRDRALNGLGQLVEDPLLSQAAQRHAQDMLDRHYYAHVSPEGRTPSDRFHQVGGNPRIGVGENIMLGRDSSVFSLTYKLVEEYQKSWMYSQGHRENLLQSRYTRFGYGIAVGAGRQYAVQEFAGPEE